MSDDARRARREGLAELTEDAVGFGGQELRLTRDLILRPRAVMDAYDAHGPTAGGRYPKPLRYYLTLNGVYLIILALLGGFDRSLQAGLPPAILNKLAHGAGKDVGAFAADMDQWFSLASVPLLAVFIGGAVFMLIRRWSPADDRTDFRQTFVFMSAWTLYGAPFGIAGQFSHTVQFWASPLALLMPLLIYARLGGCRWWRTKAGAVGKGALLLLAVIVSFIPASILIWAVAIFGARFLP